MYERLFWCCVLLVSFWRREREKHRILTQMLIVTLSLRSLPCLISTGSRHPIWFPPLISHCLILPIVHGTIASAHFCVFPANPQHPTALQHGATSAAAGATGIGPQRTNSGAENYPAGADPCRQRSQHQPACQYPAGEFYAVLCAKFNFNPRGTDLGQLRLLIVQFLHLLGPACSHLTGAGAYYYSCLAPFSSHSLVTFTSCT